MRIEDTFRVNRPIDEAWQILLDIERIAPLLPGAELHEAEGDEYRGVVKVKVGPISAQYKGVATLVEADEAGHRIVIDARGRETRGQGNARAAIEVTMSPDGDATEVAIVTDLSITGRVAQLGRGMLADVSAKLLEQFAANLEEDLSRAEREQVGDALEGTGPPEPSTEAVPADRPATGSVDPSLRRFEPAPAEPVDLLDVAGAPLARRAVPVVVAVLLLVVAWRLWRGRARPG